MQKIIINGSNFRTLKQFFKEMETVLTFNLNWKPNPSLDGFNDLLRGGFGVFDYEEQIKLVWQNYDKSQRNLDKKELDLILEIIAEHKHIDFIIVD